MYKKLASYCRAVWSALLHTKKPSLKDRLSVCLRKVNLYVSSGAWGRDMWYMIACAWPLTLSGGTSTHIRMAKPCMQTQLHLHAVVPTQIHTHYMSLVCTHRHRHTHYMHYTFHHSESTRLLAHTETNTYNTHTVNLTPCSNAERIVPGLGDIKSLDYPIKSYSNPLPLLCKISGTNHCTTSRG